MMIDDYYPKLEEILRYRDQASRTTSGWHKKILRRRKLYDQDHYSRKPKQGEDRYEDPTYTNVVDLAIGTVLANDLEFRAFGWTPSIGEQKDSSHIEKFLAGLIQINSMREEKLIPYEILMNFTRDGCAVLYSIWNEALAQEYSRTFTVIRDDVPTQVQGFVQPPIQVTPIDPLKITMIQGGRGRWSHVFRTEKMSVGDVEEEFGVIVKGYENVDLAARYESEGTLTDYWCLKEIEENQMDEMGQPVLDPETGFAKMSRKVVVVNSVLFDDQFIWKPRVMDGMDELPFTIGFFKPVDSGDPEKWGHSMIDPLESTISLLEKDVNRRQKQITIFSALPMVATTNGGRKIQVDPSLGAVVHLNADEKLNFPQWQGNPPDVEMQIAFLRARAQQSGFSDVMFGAGPTQVSGYGLSQLGDQNRIRLEQPVQHLQMFWMRWAMKVLKLASYYAGDYVLRVYGRMRGMDFVEQIFPKDLADYQVICIIKPEFPNDKTRNHAMATQASPFVSQYTLLQSYLGIEQPDQEIERKLTEQAMNHPLMIQYGIMKQLEIAARGDPQDPNSGDRIAGLILKQLSTQASQPQPAMPGGPPQPGRNPEQPMGLASSTGQLTQQEGGQQPPGQSEQDMIQQMQNAAPNLFGGV